MLFAERVSDLGAIRRRQEAQRRQLAVLATWLRNTSTALGSVAFVLATAWSDVSMGLSAAAVFGSAACHHYAYWLVARGRRRRAAVAVYCGSFFFLAASFVVDARPTTFGALVVATLLLIASSPRHACAAIGIFGIVTLGLVDTILWWLATTAIPARVPSAFVAAYVLTSSTASLFLLFHLGSMWHRVLRVRTVEAELSARSAERERRRLATERGRLMAMLANQREGVILSDDLGHVVLMNAAAEELTGWPFEEARSRPVSEVVMLEQNVSATTFVTLEDIWKDVVASGQPFHEMRDVFLTSRYGPCSPVAASVGLLFAHPGAAQRQTESTAAHRRGPTYGGIITLRDMSTFVESLSHDHRRERLHIVQSMVDVVAKLSCTGSAKAPAAQSTIQILQRQPPRLEGTHEALNEPRLQESTAGSCPVTLHRRRPSTPSSFLPSELLVDVAQCLPRLLGLRALIVVQPSNKIGRLHADFGGIRELLLQLALVGRRRMATAGTVTLSAHHWAIDDAPPRLALGEVAPGAYIRLDVADSGCTHSREQLLRFFEPFQFATPNEIGQSFDLAASCSIIRENAGALVIESRRGLGSTLSVFLPALQR